MSLMVFTLTPMSDDWTAAAAPYKNDGSWSHIIPGKAPGGPFWRIPEIMLGYFLGSYPIFFQQ